MLSFILQKPFDYFFSAEVMVEGEKYIDAFDRGIFNGIGYFQLVMLVLSYLERSHVFRPFYIMPLFAGHMLKFSKNIFCRYTKIDALVKEAEFNKSQTLLDMLSSTSFGSACVTIGLLCFIEIGYRRIAQYFYFY